MVSWTSVNRTCRRHYLITASLMAKSFGTFVHFRPTR